MYHMLEVVPGSRNRVGAYLTKDRAGLYCVEINIRTPDQPRTPLGAWESGEHTYGGTFSSQIKASKSERQTSFQKDEESLFTPWGMRKSMRKVVAEVLPRKGNSLTYKTMPTGLTTVLKLALTDEEASLIDQEILIHAIFSRLKGHQPLFTYAPDGTEWTAIALLAPSVSVMQRNLVIYPAEKPTPECLGKSPALVRGHPNYTVTHLCQDGSFIAVCTQEVSSYPDWKMASY